MTSDSFRIQRGIELVRICPPGYVHVAAFDEVIAGLREGLQELGFDVSEAVNRLDRSRISIVLGAHLMQDHELDSLRGDRIVIYNLEQADRESAWIRRSYLDALAGCRVWDYSRRNIEQLGFRRPGSHAEYVPVGYAAAWSCVGDAQQDIDVLFYGSITPRRREILVALKAAGLNVSAVFGKYGRERDALIARAKVVINIHMHESRILEVVRVAYLMANSKAVVSECSEGTEVYEHLRDGLRLAPYDKLVDACRELVHDDAARRALEVQALRAVKRRTFAQELVSSRSVAGELPACDRPQVPRRLNLGSGNDWRVDCLNVDILERVQPDLVLDICAPLPLGKTFSSGRFADFELRPGSFDLIIARRVLEQLADLVTAMTSCLALLAEGGEMHVEVPYDLSLGAWDDPAHVRAFNERSWWCYTIGHQQLGWNEARFTLVQQELIPSPYGAAAKARGVSDEDLVRLPRAVDAMKVVLRKTCIDRPLLLVADS